MDVKNACLGILSRGDRTGYEIKKLFEEGPYSHFFEAGFGSIYPALANLCANGYATVREIQDEGRRRKLYSITEAGRQAFLAALCKPPAADRCRSEWVFMAYFAELLPAGLLERRIAERLDWYRRQLAQMQACAAEPMAPGQRFVLELGRSVYAAAAGYLEREGPALIEAARAPRNAAAD